MTKGTACRIFENINQETYTEAEKLEAITIVTYMETHNGIQKKDFVSVLKWLLGHQICE